MNRKYKGFFLLIVVLMTGSAVFGQQLHGKARKYARLADFELYSNNFLVALDLYKQAYAIDSTNPGLCYKMGVCMFNFRKYKKQSQPFFEKALGGGELQAEYYLGCLYHLNGKFEAAMRMYEKYKEIPGTKDFSNEEVDVLIHKSKTAIEFTQNPVSAATKNLGPVVNSEYPDYVPVISADESVLIFTSRRKGSTGGILDPLGEYFEDVYISHKEDSVWSAPAGISTRINTGTHDACVSLSADGELLFLYRTSEDLLSGDLYSSAFDGKDWTVPTKLPSPINSTEYTEPSIALSADGQTIYFSSNRPGGFGKKDIYKVIKLPSGEWSQPWNMGPSVNTSEDEDALFIHPDGKIFYFSSKGHKNMGGYDIFKSTCDDHGIWSEAENMGCPINTPDDDVFFVLSTNGRTGYYSSERSDGYGGADIYQVEFLDEDFGLTVYNAMVTNEDGSPLHARIYVYETQANKMIGTYSTNKLTGKFIVIYKPGREYFMKVEAEGYSSFVGLLNPPAMMEIDKIKLQRTKE